MSNHGAVGTHDSPVRTNVFFPMDFDWHQLPGELSRVRSPSPSQLSLLPQYSPSLVRAPSPISPSLRDGFSDIPLDDNDRDSVSRSGSARASAPTRLRTVGVTDEMAKARVVRGGVSSQVGMFALEVRELRARTHAQALGSRNSQAALTMCAPNPLLERVFAAMQSGPSIRDDRAMLGRFLAECEKEWGVPVIDASIAHDLVNPDLFAVQKAIALCRMGRSPETMTEGFSIVHGSEVHGDPIADRQILWRQLMPIGIPNGDVVMIAPGVQETSMHFMEQAHLLATLGYHVVLMDQQWAGQTKTRGTDGYWRFNRGGLDCGNGVARDVAYMACFAQRIFEQRYQDIYPQGSVVLFGNSMGASAGVLLAEVLNAKKALKLGRDCADGPELTMPLRLPAVLQSPFFRATPTPMNRFVSWLSQFDTFNTAALPSVGLPNLTDDPVGARKVDRLTTEEDVRVQMRTMTSAVSDLDYIHLALAQPSTRIKDDLGPLRVVQGRLDPLADIAATREVLSRVGSLSEVLVELPGCRSHVLENNPVEQVIAIKLLQALRGRTQDIHGSIQQARSGGHF